MNCNGAGRRLLLADGHVEAADAGIALGQDGVDAHGGLAGLTVADDQFALAAADGRHGVDGLDAGGHGLVHRLAGDDAGRLQFHGAELLGFQRAQAVNGLAEGVEHAAHDLVTHGNREDLAGTLDRVAFLDACVFTQKSNTHVVLFKVQHHAHETAGELEQFHGHGVTDAVDARNAVTDRKDGAGFAHLDPLLIALDLLFDDLADFFGFDLHSPTHPS